MFTNSERPARRTAIYHVSLLDRSAMVEEDSTCGYEDWRELWEVESVVTTAEVYAHLRARLLCCVNFHFGLRD